MECYISPSEAFTIEDVSASIRAQPYGAYLLVAGGLNAKLADSEGTPRGEAIVVVIVVEGLLDLGLNFLPQRKLWLQDRYTWIMWRDVREVRYWMDCILGTDCRLFQDVAVWDP